MDKEKLNGIELNDEELEQINGGEWGLVIDRKQRNMLEFGLCYKDNALLIPLVREPNKKICICSECGTLYRRKIRNHWEEDK